MSVDHLQKWLKTYGTERVAIRLGISPGAVRIWARREGYPKVETMDKLIKLSRGKLTHKKIIESCRPN